MLVRIVLPATFGFAIQYNWALKTYFDVSAVAFFAVALLIQRIMLYFIYQENNEKYNR